jgi:hypothetical protein
MATEDNSRSSHGLLWFILLIIALIIFIACLPVILLRDKQRELREEKLRTREALERERALLRGIVQEKKEIIERLNARFKKKYLHLRIGLVAVWVIVLVVYTICSGLEDWVGAIVNLNGLALFFILLLNFLVYGKITDTRELAGQGEEIYRNWIFRHHAGIKEELVQYNASLDLVESRIQAIERELDELERNSVSTI